ncbi:MAG: FtsX-like permease family protein [Flammeovirgaceae bacterium]|nr:FtsX-like permease family protein [Flammeovirgaceae bacterium]
MWESEFTIIGLVEDVLMASPYEPVDPMVIVHNPTWSSTITMRLSKDMDLKDALSRVEEGFKTHNPSHPFEYRFADVTFDKKFSTITMIQNLANIFAGLAIIITSLGLFGLASFTAEQRTKEIGIRKVMGASVGQLIILISKDFSRLVILAFLISSPVAWWILNDFLERYPYRIDIPLWALPVTGLIALLITLLVVSSQAAKAALNNPVNSLRSE